MRKPFTTTGTRLGRRQAFATGRGGSTLLRGLLGYWRHEEAANVDRLDATPAGLTMSKVAAGVSQETGKVGFASGFATASDQYLVGDHAALRLSVFTIAGWAAVDDVTQTNATFASRWDTSKAAFLIKHRGATGTVRLSWTSDADHTSPTDITTADLGLINGDWFFWAIRFAADQVDLRINTTDSSSSGDDTPVYVGVTPFLIGGELSSGSILAANSFEGKVDEVGFWNRVLSDDELTTLYNAGTGLQYPFA